MPPRPGTRSAQQLFDYYLGYLAKPVAHHFTNIPDGDVGFAKHWGMTVAVGDLRRVITRGAPARGARSCWAGTRSVAAWSPRTRAGTSADIPGANGLSGLVYIDGGSFGTETASQARSALTTLDAPAASPWEKFGGIPAPLAGIFSAIGATAALAYPNAPSLAQQSGLLTPFGLNPPVPVTNLALYGNALNVGTSPSGLAAAQAHLGKGVAPPVGRCTAGTERAPSRRSGVSRRCSPAPA